MSRLLQLIAVIGLFAAGGLVLVAQETPANPAARQPAPTQPVAPAHDDEPQTKAPRPVRVTRPQTSHPPARVDIAPGTPTPQAPPAASAGAIAAPIAPVAAPPTPVQPARRPSAVPRPRQPRAPQPPQQVVTVVHRLSGWKLLAWLALSGPPALEIDRFPTSDVHTNIVAGFLSPDGKTVMARIPRAEVELEAFGLSTTPPATLAPGVKFYEQEVPEYMLVSREGKRVRAKFVGLDSVTGLSLLEAEEVLALSNGEAGHTEGPSVGQRVHLFAPALVPAAGAGDQGDTDSLDTIYVDMGRTTGQLVAVRRATAGTPAAFTARAPLASPALAGAVATTEAGVPLGIVATSGPSETRIVPFDDVRAAAKRVRAVRSVVVPQPWLGFRGDAAFKASLHLWLEQGWKTETAMSLRQAGKGVFVTSVVPQTPAFEFGLRSGDVISRVDERDVSGIDDLTVALREAGVGSSVNFTVFRATTPVPFNLPLVVSGSPHPAVSTLEAELRAARSRVFEMRGEFNAARSEEEQLRLENKQEQKQSATIAQLESRRRRAEKELAIARSRYAVAEERVAQARARVLRITDWSLTTRDGFFTRPLRTSGLEVLGLTPRSAARLGAKGGVLVVHVQPDSSGARQGIQPGDVIESVGGKTFSNAELRSILKDSTESQLTLGVVRGATKLTIFLPLDDREKE